MSLLRSPAARQLSRLQVSHRCFSIKAQRAAKYLSDQLGVPVSSSSASTSSSPRDGLAILLHADRRAQRVGPDSTTFFGPTLVAVSTSRLSNTPSNQRFGEGDLGLLALSQAPGFGAKQAIQGHKGDMLQPSSVLCLLEREEIDDALKSEKSKKAVAEMLVKLWQVFKRGEGIWFTCVVHEEAEGVIDVSSPYLEFDDYAVHRMPEDLQELHKAQEEEREPNSAQASDGGLFYIKLHNGGNIGSFGYGAGNAMATMDGLALAGGKPANFLDGGGGANRKNSELAIETLNRDPDVKAIFVNTFGGITQTDVVADGIIDAIRANDMKQPIVVRVMGTGADEAKRKLRESGLKITIEDDFKAAARLAVEQAEQAEKGEL
ncbi:succinyl-CoA synthetase-like protein [Jaminaea rosea]|uniref:Succinyl-CoA synthetase-like protein n=1 Tax=Jaminaea rosea TaxID=1569628 RepID=A0A316UW10_9BASI|nr:succinyl-CoA synthetase-like protein [Jaminaea rosea]PWN28988.1 succinyl-CoA synthetase-like protein [Jaminaea rosea]